MTDPYKELREGLERLKAADGVLRGPEADVAALLAERDALRDALQAAVDCGMVPKSSASEGGANKYSKQVRVADQIRAALSQSEPQGQR